MNYGLGCLMRDGKCSASMTPAIGSIAIQPGQVLCSFNDGGEPAVRTGAKWYCRPLGQLPELTARLGSYLLKRPYLQKFSIPVCPWNVYRRLNCGATGPGPIDSTFSRCHRIRSFFSRFSLESLSPVPSLSAKAIMR